MGKANTILTHVNVSRLLSPMLDMPHPAVECSLTISLVVLAHDCNHDASILVIWSRGAPEQV